MEHYIKRLERSIEHYDTYSNLRHLNNISIDFVQSLTPLKAALYGLEPIIQLLYRHYQLKDLSGNNHELMTELNKNIDHLESLIDDVYAHLQPSLYDQLAVLMELSRTIAQSLFDRSFTKEPLLWNCVIQPRLLSQLKNTSIDALNPTEITSLIESVDVLVDQVTWDVQEMTLRLITPPSLDYVIAPLTKNLSNVQNALENRLKTLYQKGDNMMDYQQLVAQHHTFAFKVAKDLLKKTHYLSSEQEIIVQYDFDPEGRLQPSYPEEEVSNSFILSLDENLIDGEHARDVYMLADAVASEFLFIIAEQMAEILDKIQE